ncbi:hypothetical protein [Enterococcus columbae]|uniref:Uncharacterized protein n=1 Tax=Enterococcus columbae DSM 7374 = ATCC 51263 TaxID=1121865 RepID=S1P5W3_9ENTE|nr:hypothetical protein [Enterococcus columbae]EOT38588.1 hypothetical protein OMW_02228 [Enterococcus columbae DSM 7374 = ATCC 51263]EOW87761.1 hypothetical protein I568_00047 [Enterococcus columbae DSM 7374 = ATCC 51263]
MKRNEKTFTRYYLPFLSSAMSLSLIRFSWLSAILSLFHYAITCFNDQSGYYKAIFQLFIIVNACSIVLSFIKRIYYKFQVATFILIGINFLIILLDLDFLGLLMFTNANVNYNNVYSWYALLYIIVMLVTIIVSSVYYGYCYKIKKERVLGCGVEAKKKENSHLLSYGIIFGLVLLAPSLLTGHIQNLFGVLLGLLFSVVSPGLIVDSFYAAYLIHKDPEYKETRETMKSK